jgi:hypothetical protein
MKEEITCTNEALELARLWEKAGPAILAKRAAKHFDADDMDEVALYLVRIVNYYHYLSHKIMRENGYCGAGCVYHSTTAIRRHRKAEDFAKENPAPADK